MALRSRTGVRGVETSEHQKAGCVGAMLLYGVMPSAAMHCANEPAALRLLEVDRHLLGVAKRPKNGTRSSSLMSNEIKRPH